MIGVKGVAMPKKCLGCMLASGYLLLSENGGEIENRVFCRVQMKMNDNAGLRPQWCPLVEIPDRLEGGGKEIVE